MQLIVVIVAAITCGMACYLPTVGLRGALYCALPGMVRRSVRVAIIGLCVGFVIDWGVVIATDATVKSLDPRAGYNAMLIKYLPPGHRVGTTTASRVSNGVQIGISTVMWVISMFYVYVALRERMISVKRLCVGVCTVGLLASAFMWGLWALATKPLLMPKQFVVDESESALFLALFFMSMPMCTMVAAFTTFGDTVVTNGDRSKGSVNPPRISDLPTTPPSSGTP